MSGLHTPQRVAADIVDIGVEAGAAVATLLATALGALLAAPLQSTARVLWRPVLATDDPDPVPHAAHTADLDAARIDRWARTPAPTTRREGLPALPLPRRPALVRVRAGTR